MQYQKKVYFIFTIASLFFFNACTPDKVPPNQGGYYYRGIYFGVNLTQHYKKGIHDGCETARGDYHKSHWLFNNSNDYNNGWFLGRKKCRGLLKIDEDDNLIL